MSQAAATAESQSGVVAPAADADSGPAGWGLVIVAGLGGLLTVQSLLGSWLTRRVTVTDVRDSESAHGIGYFGELSIGIGAALVALGVLTGLALWRTGRLRVWFSYAALALTAVLYVAVGLVVVRLAEQQDATAATVARLRASVQEGLPTEVAFHLASPSLLVATAATFLFMLAVLQRLWPARAIVTQAVTGVVLGLLSAGLPWTRFWVVDDRESVPYETRSFWVWSSGWDDLLLVVVFALLLVVAFACLRAPGYARGRWALGTVPFAAWIFFGVVAAENDNLSDALELEARVSEVLDSSSTGAGALLAIGAVLLLVAALRSWWHGREEVTASDGSWLPSSAADRRVRQEQVR